MMIKNIFTTTVFAISFVFSGCSSKIINLADTKLQVINREISSLDETNKSVSLNDKENAGLAILQEIDFNVGIIEIDLKGENTPGRSFVGIAFNIKNDSTYEAIYFRPFNFQAKDRIRREHSVQYISHPTHDWRYLRTNNEGQFEAEYDRQPSPEDWFSIKIKIEEKRVFVFDSKSDKELLAVRRLADQASNRIGLWTGHNSKGAFRNLVIR